MKMRNLFFVFTTLGFCVLSSATAQEVAADLDPIQPNEELSAVAAGAPVIKIQVPANGAVFELPFAFDASGEAIYQGDIVIGSKEKLSALINGSASLQSVGGVESFGVVVKSEARRWPHATGTPASRSTRPAASRPPRPPAGGG